MATPKPVNVALPNVQVHSDYVIQSAINLLGRERPVCQLWQIEKLEEACKIARKQLDQTAPSLEIKLYLIEHGYQLDAFDSNGREVGSECRDFGGEYPPEKMRDIVLGGVLSVMRKAETAYRKAHVHKRRTK
jgi:hypothetical protein